MEKNSGKASGKKTSNQSKIAKNDNSRPNTSSNISIPHTILPQRPNILAESLPERDEIAIIGELVVSRLRSIKNPALANSVKLKLTQFLWGMDCGAMETETFYDN